MITSSGFNSESHETRYSKVSEHRSHHSFKIGTKLFAGIENEDIDATFGSDKSNKIGSFARVIYAFSRPHTIKGTILASVMGVCRSLAENPSCLKLKLVPKALIGLLALLCGNAYIVGINQIYDVKIDEINKPYLPIAAKKLSKTDAWKVVVACLLTGTIIVKSLFSQQIFLLYVAGMFLGTIYSVPPLQLKRFPVCAGLIIAIVRGFLLNFGVYYAVREALSIPFSWNPVVTFISVFMTLFASIIAITKDLPDIEGDVKYNINTFASRYGVKNIALFSTTLLSSAYIAAISLPFLIPNCFKKFPMTVGHFSLLLYLVRIYSKLDPANITSIKQFYKSIWNLFYLEYVIYSLI